MNLARVYPFHCVFVNNLQGVSFIASRISTLVSGRDVEGTTPFWTRVRNPFRAYHCVSSAIIFHLGIWRRDNQLTAKRPLRARRTPANALTASTWRVNALRAVLVGLARALFVGLLAVATGTLRDALVARVLERAMLKGNTFLTMVHVVWSQRCLFLSVEYGVKAGLLCP